MMLLLLSRVLSMAALAQDYAFPTTSSDYSKFYPTAYRDHNSGSGLDDWNCGSDTYDGHSGNDFGAGSWSGMDAGRDITAAADGVVTYTHDGEADRCSTGACGTSNSVTIEHADGKKTIYYHLKKNSVLVNVGDVLSCGQKIGLMGSSGNSTGPHLHFGVYNTSGSAKDPFYGSCSSGTNWWVSQGSYGGLPSRTCDTSVTPSASTEALIATSTDRRKSTDINGDRQADLCGRANAGIYCLWGHESGLIAGFANSLLSNDTGLNASPDHTTTLRWGDINGDRRDDLCYRTDDAFVCHLSDGAGLLEDTVPGSPDWSNARGFDGADQYTTIRMAELNGDGRMDLCARSADGIECVLATATGFGEAFAGPALSDASGWSDFDNFSTLRFADLNGDGLDDLCARANAGMRCWRGTGSGFDADAITGPEWSDDEGFSSQNKYASIHFADIDGDGMADLFARTADGISVALSTGEGFAAELVLASYKDSSGWDDADNALTIRLGDLDGDGDLDLCGRANSSGILCRRWMGPEGFETSNLAGPDWDNDANWDARDNYWSIAFADVTGDGMEDLFGRAPEGFSVAPANGSGFDAVVTASTGTDAAGWNGGDNWPTVHIGGPHSPGCADADADFTCDDADACPTDPNKTEPGLCGCFALDIDSDGDSLCDVDDGCPDDAYKSEPGDCGCGQPEDDSDDDGLADCIDPPTPEGDSATEDPAEEATDSAGVLEVRSSGGGKQPGGCSTLGGHAAGATALLLAWLLPRRRHNAPRPKL